MGDVFERYSERARRVVFYARYEAAQFGSPDIDTEHLLLGLLRAGKGVVGQVLQRHAITVADLRRKLPGPPPGEPVTHSVDLPLSAGARRILAYAGEEAELMHHDVIEVGHLLLGILREEASTAAQVLIDAGLTLENARRDLVDVMARRPASPVDSGPPMEKLVRFLSEIGRAHV